MSNNLRQESGDILLPYFKTSVDVKVREATEFETIRIQLKLLELYRRKVHLVVTGVNDIEIQIPVQVEGVGKATIYSINFNSKGVSRWVYLTVLLIGLSLVYLICKYRKRL